MNWKNKKKALVFSFIFVLSVIFLSSFVLGADAQNTGYKLGGELANFINGVRAFFGGAAEGVSDTSFGLETSNLATILLFSILLAMIVYSVLDSTLLKGSSNFIKWTASISITLLALVGLPPGYLNSISTSYGAMGASILVVIPFLIVLLFTVKTDNLFIAKMTWLAFALYYLVIYFQRIWSEETLFSSGNWPNLVGFIIGIVAFFWIPYIKNLIFNVKLKDIQEKGKINAEKRKALLNLEMNRLEKTGGS